MCSRASARRSALGSLDDAKAASDALERLVRDGGELTVEELFCRERHEIPVPVVESAVELRRLGIRIPAPGERRAPPKSSLGAARGGAYAARFTVPRGWDSWRDGQTTAAAQRAPATTESPTSARRTTASTFSNSGGRI
jgi:hypothetical protein